VNSGDYETARLALHALFIGSPLPLRPFYQGLVTLALALNHYKRGEQPGMLRMLKDAIERLEPFRPDFMGVDTEGLVESMKGARQHALELGWRRFRQFDAALLPRPVRLSTGIEHLPGEDGPPIAYREWAGSSAPILLIHAPGHSAVLWTPVAVRLGPHRVLGPDLPGHGASPSFPGEVDDHGRAVRAWARARAPEATAVVAVGGSGAVAAEIALELKVPLLGLAPDAPTGPVDPGSARQRRRIWGTRYEMFEAYRGREPFSGWRPDLLWSYVEHGTYALEDGRIQLRGDPEAEAAMLDLWRRSVIEVLRLEPSPLVDPSTAASAILAALQEQRRGD
jgi:pimeloyl-ACP methyl ester carboxylesterase